MLIIKIVNLLFGTMTTILWCSRAKRRTEPNQGALLEDDSMGAFEFIAPRHYGLSIAFQTVCSELGDNDEASFYCPDLVHKIRGRFIGNSLWQAAN